MAHYLSPQTPNRYPADAPCKRGCCWTQYGHSTVRDAYTPGNPLACKCHPGERKR